MTTIKTTPQKMLRMMMDLKAGIPENMTDAQRSDRLQKLTRLANDRGYIRQNLRFLELATRMLMSPLTHEEEVEINQLDITLRKRVTIRV